MKAIYALSLLAAAASALTFKQDPFWKSYKATFGKTYENDAEEARRYEIFNKNMQKAAELNANPDDDATYGMTVVSDRFPEEIRTKLDIPKDIVGEPEPATPSVAAPYTFDARNKGWIPAIRDQGQCGSCWAFSAAASIAANYAKKKGTTPPVLSEQQLVDCSPNDHGCSGGWPTRATTYAKNGIMLNSAYPYTARAGTCKFSSSKVKTKVSSTGDIGKSVSSMKDAIQNYGSLMVALNADKLQGYTGNIISASGCSTSVDHAVNIVGWGNNGSTEYWIVRNSWGTSWGKSGYFYIVTGKNACGIESYPMYVTVQ